MRSMIFLLKSEQGSEASGSEDEPALYQESRLKVEPWEHLMKVFDFLKP
jgi:hypothetical protein